MHKLTIDDIEKKAEDLYFKLLIQKIAETIIESRKKKMQVVYEVNLKVTVVHEVSELKELKTNSEFVEDLRTMICDEATVAGGVALVDILNSSIDVK